MGSDSANDHRCGDMVQQNLSADLRKRLVKSVGSCNGQDVKNSVVRRISILNWIGSYQREDLLSDFIAGITLGLTIIPQSLAYAGLAGLPSHYGLYAAYMGEYGLV